MTRLPIAATLLASVWGFSARGVMAAPAPQGVAERHVEVGGAGYRALCTEGPVAVLLLHGEGDSAEAWRPVLERLDGRTGACAYDRLGGGGGGQAPSPRGWFELLDEMAGVHRALGAGRPYVLVGHSLGGLYARLYAADRPVDVRGLVLVEPAHERMPEKARRGMPEDAWRAWAARRERPNEDGLREVEIAARAARARLPRIPVTVITATERRSGEDWDPRWLNEAARTLHGELVDGLRLGRHVPAPGSGHDVPRDDPRLVSAEILRVLGLAR